MGAVPTLDEIRGLVQSALPGTAAALARLDPARAARVRACDVSGEPDAFAIERDPKSGAVVKIEARWGPLVFRAAPGLVPGRLERTLGWEAVA